VNLSLRSSLHLRRGLVATILCGLGGAGASVAVALEFTFCRWLVLGTREVDHYHDLRYLEQYMVYPMVGCAVVCACAGWATFTPAGTWRLARSLAFIFLVSLPLWFVICLMELTPPRYKATEHPVFYCSELMVLMGPPLMAAALLTALRIRGASTLPSS
jgi:hypothetical protein